MVPANDSRPAPRRKPAERPIHLHIAGGDLLLNGRFSNWVPVAVERPDADGGSMQLLVDVTSMAGRGKTTDAFSFTSRQVRSVAPLTYAAKGTLRAGRMERDLELVLQTPPSHTPFMMVTLGLPRDEFKALWRHVDRKLPRPNAKDESELRAIAWLREPTVAAA